MSAYSATEACTKPDSQEALVKCLEVELKKAEAELTRYFNASMKRHGGDTMLSTQIKGLYAAAIGTRGVGCNVVGLPPRDAAKVEAQRLICRLRTTRQQTHELWELFLTYPDAKPPDLPEPERYTPPVEPLSTEANSKA